jgi:hypothetical protein
MSVSRQYSYRFEKRGRNRTVPAAPEAQFMTAEELGN